MNKYEVRSGWSTESNGNVIETYHINANCFDNAVKQVMIRDLTRKERKAVTNDSNYNSGYLLLDKLVYNNSEEYSIDEYVKEFGKPELDEYDQFVDDKLESKTYYWDIRQVTKLEEDN